MGCRTTNLDSQQLRVYAATSLTEPFQALEKAFETVHPDVDILLTFAGSQVLRLQIEHGAHADIFASANQRHIQALIDQGIAGESRIFIRNALVVIVPPDNPSQIFSFADLAKASRLVLGTENVPVGRYARLALKRAGLEKRVLPRVVSLEKNVRLVRAKVALGEADAAVTYQSDALSFKGVRSIAIPAAYNPRIEYSIAILARVRNRPLAELWLEFVLSGAGQAIMERHGFEALK
jgi:molybdate transport system substrate-binding protein